MKDIKNLVFLFFIIVVIFVYFQHSNIEENKYKNNYKSHFQEYCKTLKNLEFKGKIIAINKTYSSGVPDIIYIKCWDLKYSNPSNFSGMHLINDSTLQLDISREYTRGYDENLIVVGDLFKCDKGSYFIERISPNREKIKINILENGYNCKCIDNDNALNQSK